MAKSAADKAFQDYQKEKYGYGKATPRIDARSGINNAEDWVKTGRWVLVKSSNVRRIRYEKAAQKLWVQFKTGTPYYYPSITTRQAKQMFHAASMGKFVWALRRKGYVGIKT